MANSDWKGRGRIHRPDIDVGAPDPEPLASIITSPWAWFPDVPAVVGGRNDKIFVMTQIAWDKDGVAHLVAIRTPGIPLTDELLRSLPLRDLRLESAFVLGPKPKPWWWNQDPNNPNSPTPTDFFQDREHAIRYLWQVVVPDIGDYRDDINSTGYLERVAALSLEAKRLGMPMNRVVGCAAKAGHEDSNASQLGYEHRDRARKAGFDAGFPTPKTTRKRGGPQKGTTK